MSWTGSSIFSPCRVSFQGYDPDRPEDKYKTCIKATTWNVKNSDIKLQYYSGSGFLFNYLDKVLTRKNNKQINKIITNNKKRNQ